MLIYYSGNSYVIEYNPERLVGGVPVMMTFHDMWVGRKDQLERFSGLCNDREAQPEFLGVIGD